MSGLEQVIALKSPKASTNSPKDGTNILSYNGGS